MIPFYTTQRRQGIKLGGCAFFMHLKVSHFFEDFHVRVGEVVHFVKGAMRMENTCLTFHLIIR